MSELRGRNTLAFPCKGHKPNKMGYLDWHLWAEKKVAMRHRQRQCPDCRRFFFKCEWGNTGRPWGRPTKPSKSS